jgi:hypothetical protein
MASEQPERLESFGDVLEFFAVKDIDVQPLQTGGQGIAGVRKHLTQLLGGLVEESLAEQQGHAAELAVKGLDTGRQRALGAGLQEALMGGGLLACEKGVGDEVSEQGEGEDLLIGPSMVSLEDTVQEVVGRNVIEQSEGVWSLCCA